MSDLLKKSLGQRVRAARESRGVSQESLAKRVGKTVETISNLERGKTLPGLDALQDIAAALNVRLSTLLDEPTVGASVRRLDSEAKMAVALGSLSDADAELALGIIQLLISRERK